MEGVEVERVVHVLILYLGLPVGGAVITLAVHSVDVSISAACNKRILLHRVEIVCQRVEDTKVSYREKMTTDTA